MKLFIPVVGTQLTLTKPATVLIKNIGQNERFASALGAKTKEDVSVTLPLGTLLTVDRVYIRQGGDVEYNSLTFKMKANNEAKIPAGRFFLPIDIVNTLNVEINLAKPQAKTHDLYAEYGVLWSICAKKEFESGWPFNQLLRQTFTCPTIAQGDVQINLRVELDLLTQAVTKNCARLGLDSFLTMLEQIADIANPEQLHSLQTHLRDISLQLDPVCKALSRSDYDSIYRFRLFRFNEQSGMVLESFLNRPLLENLDVAEQNYHFIFCLWLKLYDKPENRDKKIYWNSALSYIKRGLERPDLGVYPQETFGSYPDNGGRKEPLTNLDRTIAILPSDAFSDNLLTRVKFSEHGHQFTYQLLSGERMTPAQIRKLK